MEQTNWAQLNNDLTTWSKESKYALLDRIEQLKIGDYKYKKGDGAGEKSVRNYTRKRYDVIDKISFRFIRYMVYVEKGVGRGVPIESVRNGNASKYKRVAKPWFNPVIEQKLDELPAIVLAPYAGITLSNLKNALIK